MLLVFSYSQLNLPVLSWSGTYSPLLRESIRQNMLGRRWAFQEGASLPLLSVCFVLPLMHAASSSDLYGWSTRDCLKVTLWPRLEQCCQPFLWRDSRDPQYSSSLLFSCCSHVNVALCLQRSSITSYYIIRCCSHR